MYVQLLLMVFCRIDGKCGVGDGVREFRETAGGGAARGATL